MSDENQSRYIEHNIETYCGDPASVDPGDDDFVESNLMHGINGLLYCNLNEMFMCEGEKVRWYTFAFGTEVDLHTRKFSFFIFFVCIVFCLVFSIFFLLL